MDPVPFLTRFRWQLRTLSRNKCNKRQLCDPSLFRQWCRSGSTVRNRYPSKCSKRRPRGPLLSRHWFRS
ncbi:hypothetical protein LAB1_30470 [Roseibium sp. LAB1]